MSCDEDEVLELAIAPIGSTIYIESVGVGNVRSISPGGSRMLVGLGATEEDDEVWVGADDPWTLSDLVAPGPAASPEVVDATGGDAADITTDFGIEDDGPEGAPILENWRWTPDGALCGYVYGKAGYREGEMMTTSVVPPEGRFASHVVTESGSAYRCLLYTSPSPRDS